MAGLKVEWKEVLITLGHVLAWYVFSIGITFYNKWLFKVCGRRDQPATAPCTYLVVVLAIFLLPCLTFLSPDVVLHRLAGADRDTGWTSP